jgi:hypothetical protein
MNFTTTVALVCPSPAHANSTAPTHAPHCTKAQTEHFACSFVPHKHAYAFTCAPVLWYTPPPPHMGSFVLCAHVCTSSLPPACSCCVRAVHDEPQVLIVIYSCTQACSLSVLTHCHLATTPTLLHAPSPSMSRACTPPCMRSTYCNEYLGFSLCTTRTHARAHSSCAPASSSSSLAPLTRHHES